MRVVGEKHLAIYIDKFLPLVKIVTHVILLDAENASDKLTAGF